MATSSEYSLGPSVFPRGWFVIAESKELTDKPLPLRFFGKDFALYRGESGKVVLLDAYCPHMGTHLAASTSTVLSMAGKQIEGDSIRCPYHGWRFNAKGECDDIPYFDGACPRSASLNSYTVVESMGCVMAWLDDEDWQGTPDYPAPFLEDWNDPSWVRWSLDHCGEIAVHPQEILDNMADLHHLGPTHGAPCEFFETEFRDHLYIQRQGGVHEDYGVRLESVTWYTGPGILLSKQIIGDRTSYIFIAHTPVDDGTVKVWHAVLYQSEHAIPDHDDKQNAREAQAMALAALANDFSVWSNKRSAIRMIQLPTDGPFNMGRQWYGQFYTSREKAAAIQRELNGSHAVKNFALPGESAYELEEGIFE
jgi:3-ketosteroid 9alpha-monooxygenase subunit A